MSLFLEALNGADTQRAPVWLMRQAGRYLPEYRALRERYSFWQMVSEPELAARVTLQPVVRFGMDAAILFQDIMTPLPSMGVDVRFDPGPVIAEPVRDETAVARLRVPHQEQIAPFAASAVSLVAAESPVPLIGFAGGPLTLAAYLVEGGGSKDFAVFRGFARSQPALLDVLLDRLTAVNVEYLSAQVSAGAAALQLFDSWAGLFDEAGFRRHGVPYVRRIAEHCAALGVPLIYMAVGAGHLLPAIAELPVAAVSVDWRTPLAAARAALPGKAVQGNLDPASLLAPRDDLLREARRVLAEGLDGPHVFNLGHGVMRQTDPSQVGALVDEVRAYDRGAARWDLATARP